MTFEISSASTNTDTSLLNGISFKVLICDYNRKELGANDDIVRTIRNGDLDHNVSLLRNLLRNLFYEIGAVHK